MATRVPALIQLSDPRVAAQLVNKYGVGLKPLSQWEVSSGDIELTRCKSTVKAICVGLASSANYPDSDPMQLSPDANCTVKGSSFLFRC